MFEKYEKKRLDFIYFFKIKKQNKKCNDDNFQKNNKNLAIYKLTGIIELTFTLRLLY